MSHTSAPASPEAGHEPSRSTSEGHLTVGDVVALVEAAAPPGLAASWDSNGLICGDPADPVRSVLLAVDPVAAVVDEAINAGVDMVITHHPLYLRGTDHVAATDPKGRCIHRLVRAGIALLNAHTSLDAARGGACRSVRCPDPGRRGRARAARWRRVRPALPGRRPLHRGRRRGWCGR